MLTLFGQQDALLRRRDPPRLPPHRRPGRGRRLPDPRGHFPAEARAGTTGTRHKAVINVFLGGGPPHQDMWDIKTEAPAEIRGEFKPIATNVPGIQIGEVFPNRRPHGQVRVIRSSSAPPAATTPSSACPAGPESLRRDGRPAQPRRRRRRGCRGRSIRRAAVRRPGRTDRAHALVRLRHARLSRPRLRPLQARRPRHGQHEAQGHVPRPARRPPQLLASFDGLRRELDADRQLRGHGRRSPSAPSAC